MPKPPFVMYLTGSFVMNQRKPKWGSKTVEAGCPLVSRVTVSFAGIILAGKPEFNWLHTHRIIFFMLWRSRYVLMMNHPAIDQSNSHNVCILSEELSPRQEL